MRHRYPYYCGRVSPLLVGLIVFLIINAIICYIKLWPVIAETAALQAKTIATKTINKAVETTLQSIDINYSSLAVITRNERGEVTSVQTNMAQVNTIANKITLSIIEDMDALSHQTVKIPLGNLTNSHLLSGRGPNIPFYISNYEGIETSLQNHFESVGINQTLHSINLVVFGRITGVLPVGRINADLSTEICLAQTVIVGAVPEYFTQIDGQTGNVSDLIADFGPGKNGIS